MPAFNEAASDTFSYSADWQELIESGASPSSTHLSTDAQEATLVGMIPWNKQRSCARHFLGFSEATSSPYKLFRENPKAHPSKPWLYAYDVSFVPFVPKSNPSATNRAPKKAGVFDSNLEIAFHEHAIATVRYRNFRFRFLSDGAISTTQQEWKRNTYFDSEASIEALQVTGGLSQLKFAETAAGGPTVGTVFGAPVAALLAKETLLLHWINVPWEYLSKHEYVFRPSKILGYVGTVNSETMFDDGANGYAPGTLLMQPPRWVIKSTPVASADTNKPLRYVDLELRWDYFDPTKGVAGSVYRGHNLMPWAGDGATAGDGKFYFATRAGTTTGTLTTENCLIKYADHRKIFEHVSE